MLTGGCSREELVAAGTHVVLDDLDGLPRLAGRAPARHPARARSRPDLRARGSVLVAYSGGADSAFLLAAAVRALGPDRVAAATGYSDSLPEAERDPAREFAASLGVRVLTPATHEMEREGYRANGGDRCFFCKAELLDVLAPLAAEHGLAHVATGTNADDAVAGFRPGIRAAAERGAITPLRDAGPDQGQVRDGVAAVGPAHLGQAGRSLPVLAGRLRRRGHPPPAGPGGAGRGGRARRCSPPPAWRCATCGSATWATGPRSRSTRRCWPLPARSGRELRRRGVGRGGGRAASRRADARLLAGFRLRLA